MRDLSLLTRRSAAGLVALLLAAAYLVILASPSGAATAWSPAGNLAVGRQGAVAVRLGDGRVLVVGGSDAQYNPINSPALYDPASNSWSAAAPMATARNEPISILLNNGKVLVAGGETTINVETNTTEVYDPSTNTWSASGSMVQARYEAAATLLSDGTVLIAGGYGNGRRSSAERYDPASVDPVTGVKGQWTTAGSMSAARNNHTATLLPNGKVLVTGGCCGLDYYSSAEVYDPNVSPSTGNPWSPAASMATARSEHTATLLDNGKVLVAGGRSVASAEFYDPGNDSWSPAGNMSASRNRATATRLGDGTVLVAGGEDAATNATRSNTDIYSPSSGWSAGPSMATARSRHTATLLANGKVLVASGLTGTGGVLTTTAEVYGTVSVPDAPTNVNAGAGDSSAVVTWAPPASDGGSKITGYTVSVTLPTGAGITPVNVSEPARSATVTGLTNATTYTFAVTATNAVGTGAAAASNSVTPQAGQPPAESTTQTVPSGGTVTTSTLAPSSTNPTVTSVTVPSGGTVSIAESSPSTSATPPGGGKFIGQQSDITAPTATAASPLVITLQYDATVVTASKPLKTYRTEGSGPETQVPDCIGSSTALSDGSPCVTSRTKNATTGDWTVKVNTAAASRWRSGQPEDGLIEDTNQLVGYNSWTGVTDAAATGGSYRKSSKAGAKVTFKTPIATSVVWVTRKGSDQGKASVTIDGVATGTVDLYSSTTQVGAQLSYTGLASKAHTIVIKVLGTKSTSASAANVVVDAFIAAGVTTDDKATKVKYDNWVGATNTSASGSSYRSCVTANASVTFTFTGVGVDFITAKGPAYGMAQVFLDGALKGTLDLYSGTTVWKSPQSYGAATSGLHTIKVVVTGTKNASSTSTKVVFDAFVVH